MQSRTIMIVDDDPLIARALTRVLEAAGYRVVTHHSGFGLSAKVRQTCPDLVLLDVNMPGLSGDGALSSLRAMADRSRALHVPVIFHSGLSGHHLKHLAETYGAAGFLCKPAENAELLATIAAQLADLPPRAIATK